MTPKSAATPSSWITRHAISFSRRALRPRFVRWITLSKTEGAGNAGSWPPPWPACNKESRRQLPQVQPRHPGIPRAMVFTAASHSPRCAGLFGHRAATTRLRALSRVIPASGYQDRAT
jgi:hypothetical protein